MFMFQVPAEHPEVDLSPGGWPQPSRVLLLPHRQDAAHHSHHAQPDHLQVTLSSKCLLL